MSTSAQPDLNAAYKASGNPSEKDPAEQAAAESNRQEMHSNRPSQAVRQPPDPDDDTEDDATPAPLMYGENEKPVSGEEAHGRTEKDVGQHLELEGEQMAAPGEGDVATKVKQNPGSKGGA